MRGVSAFEERPYARNGLMAGSPLGIDERRRELLHVGQAPGRLRGLMYELGSFRRRASRKKMGDVVLLCDWISVSMYPRMAHVQTVQTLAKCSGVYHGSVRSQEFKLAGKATSARVKRDQGRVTMQ